MSVGIYPSVAPSNGPAMSRRRLPVLGAVAPPTVIPRLLPKVATRLLLRLLSDSLWLIAVFCYCVTVFISITALLSVDCFCVGLVFFFFDVL